MPSISPHGTCWSLSRIKEQVASISYRKLSKWKASASAKFLGFPLPSIEKKKKMHFDHARQSQCSISQVPIYTYTYVYIYIYICMCIHITHKWIMSIHMHSSSRPVRKTRMSPSGRLRWIFMTSMRFQGGILSIQQGWLPPGGKK